MTARRELVLAIGLCLLGSALVLFADARDWLVYRVPMSAPLPPRVIDVTGNALVPGARALALLGLAAVAALPATRRLGRVAVGALVALAGLGTVLLLVRVLADPERAARRTDQLRLEPHLAGSADLGGWPYLSLLGGLLLLGAGVLVVLRGRRWTGMSSRYDAPTSPKPPSEASLWDALDRGEDPTSQ